MDMNNTLVVEISLETFVDDFEKAGSSLGMLEYLLINLSYNSDASFET